MPDNKQVSLPWFDRISSRYRWIFFCIAIVAILFLLQGPRLHDQFLSDDYDWVNTARTNIEQGQWFHEFTTGNGGNFYRPLVALSFQVDYFFWKFNTFGFHLHQLFFHIILVTGVAWLVWQLFRSRSLAFAAALLFAVYPSQHEVVTWIAGRPDLYATTFIVLCVAAYATYLRTNKWLWYALSLILGLAAMISKETGLFVPLFLAGAVLLCKPVSPAKALVRELAKILPWVVMVGLALYVRSLVLTDAVGGYLVGGEQAGLHFTLGLLSKPITSIFYWINWDYAQAKFGNNGVFDVVYTFIHKGFFRWQYVAAAFGLFFLIYLYFVKNKQRLKLLLTGIVWALLAFVPVYALSAAIDPVKLSASRLFFLSSVGYALILTFTLWPPAGDKGIFATVRRIGFGLFIVLFVYLWQLNAVPWRLASDQVSQIKQKFISQQAELLKNNPSTLLVERMPGLVYGAYSYFGNHSVSGMVYETTKNKYIKTFLVGQNAYSASTLCKKDLTNKIAIITWDKNSNSFIEEDSQTIEKLTKAQIEDAPTIKWDFTNPDTVKSWQFGNLQHHDSASGVEIEVPNGTGELITSPEFPVIFNGAYRHLYIRFSVVNQSNDFGWRRVSLLWGKAGSINAFNSFKYTYGEGVDQNIDVPLCQFLNWSISDNTNQLKFLPAQSGTVILRSITLTSD